jgi:hypothetical protein
MKAKLGIVGVWVSLSGGHDDQPSYFGRSLSGIQ